jgi:2,4-dienoyl-CoA reductase-like NADH-dependent reductase (Old Yellow Enzyme family)
MGNGPSQSDGSPIASPAGLFEPLALRSVTLINRLALPAAKPAEPQAALQADQMLVHLGARACGGAGAVFAGPVAVEGATDAAEVPLDEQQYQALERAAAFVADNGCAPGLQLVHLGPAGLAAPAEDTLLELSEIRRLTMTFGLLAGHAQAAGFQLLEVCADSGLIQHFLYAAQDSHRPSNYSGNFYNRIRLLFEVLDAVRHQWPAQLPLLVRICIRERPDLCWSFDEMHKLVRLLAARGDVDMIVCPCPERVEQSPRAAAARERLRDLRVRCGLPLGLLTSCRSSMAAEMLLRGGYGDLLLNDVLVEDPNWPRRAARRLGARVQAKQA